MIPMISIDLNKGFISRGLKSLFSEVSGFMNFQQDIPSMIFDRHTTGYRGTGAFDQDDFVDFHSLQEAPEFSATGSAMFLKDVPDKNGGIQDSDPRILCESNEEAEPGGNN